MNISELLGYVFKDPSLLEQALTHSSFVYENNLGVKASNERLEFLGDAVLELLISDLLYARYPDQLEGELSKARANLVCEPMLASHARKLELGNRLNLGRGETAGGGADKDSILSDALEAIIGAIYLDGGLESARSFCYKLYENHENVNRFISDPKSHLQEIFQQKSRVSLEYAIIKEAGPAHQREFTAAVSHNGCVLGIGVGKSKKDAERNAATKALSTV